MVVRHLEVPQVLDQHPPLEVGQHLEVDLHFNPLNKAVGVEVDLQGK